MAVASRQAKCAGHVFRRIGADEYVLWRGPVVGLVAGGGWNWAHFGGRGADELVQVGLLVGEFPEGG